MIGRRPAPRTQSVRDPTTLMQLLDAAHEQLRAPIVLLWDGLSLPAMRTVVACPGQ